MNVENIIPDVDSTMFLFQVMPSADLTDEEASPEAIGRQSDRKSSLSINKLDVINVHELLESVR